MKGAYWQPMVPLLAVVLLSTPTRAQDSIIFGNANHFNNWYNDGGPGKVTPSPFLNHALLVCFKDSGNVYLLQFGGSAPAETLIGTRKNCMGSIDLNNNALPYTDVIKAIEKVAGIPMARRSGRLAHALSMTAPPRPPVLPLFRDLPFLPGYTTPALTSFSTTCDPSNDVEYLFVDHTEAIVSVSQACTGTQVGSNIPVVSNPLQVAVTPDQTLALVTSFDNAINFIDLTTLQVVFTLSTPNDNPDGIAISSDGATAYVTSFTNPGAELLTIDITGQNVTNRLALPPFPQSVFLSPDDSLAWVTCPFNNLVSVIDTLTNTVTKTLSIVSPFGVAFDSTGTRAFVTSRSNGTVQVIDTSDYATLMSVPVGTGPVEILIAPDDSYAAVSNFDGASITFMDLHTYQTSTMTFPDQPLGMAFVQ
jgi:YVTN family beta-propeller protein